MALSYHDVVVLVDDKQYWISDNYAYELTCHRATGWVLWHKWDGECRQIGGEYGGNKVFAIMAGKNVVCGKAFIPEKPKIETLFHETKKDGWTGAAVANNDGAS